MESAEEAMRQMIALRLSSGFQVVPTRKLRDTQKSSERIERMLLSMGDYYHDIRCLSEMEVQVSEYWQDLPDGLDQTAGSHYSVRIRPGIGRRAKHVEVNLAQDSGSADWPMLDDQAANPEVTHDLGARSKLRLVLIPVPFAPTEALRQLSDEERRIDGIQKLTQLWQRNRHVSHKDQLHQTSMSKARPLGSNDRDPDPLAIEYQTRDPSAVVGAYGTTLSNDPAGGEATLFPKSETFHTSSFDMAKLVKHMQEPPPSGVEMKDRRWLTRFHLRCFRGDEMTNWLLHVFRDLQTREDAVALGNQLMHKDLFTHVRGKHEFRDGNYFYQILSAYRTSVYPDTAGFFAKGMGRSMPSTPITEMRQSPSMRAMQSDSDSSGKGSPALAKVDSREKEAILLSQSLLYNVDPAKKSSQPELVTLHYDRIHNPDNCYHIQLEWTTTTAKLVREAVARWSGLVEGHGLKLVQLPILEASRLHERHPLEQAVSVKLAIRPHGRAPATPHLDPSAGSPRGRDDRYVHHKAILRKMDFVLDLEAADNFPSKLNIAYSWGRPDYRMTQFIHKSGLLLAQISNDDKTDFLLLRNRLAGQWSSHSNKRSELPSAENIFNDFRKFCKDEAALKLLYEEVNKPKVSPMSPLARTQWIGDADVPPIELPPHLMHRTQR
ncbi:vacuolar membrane-associated protein iml1 [Saxophila tyrrhenica]|uniref:Vacuolar membrane-associated protein IML1 n=1 Tax=Saxophila tyrrhenica TaxID=1690608 RepID=A0AAV9P241_9PEZI|nr:vacuolar membrane-associated protein iml1 [Saxophila tyrrhenica]